MPVSLSLLRIKMRKLPIIRCCPGKWKQCLRDHLLPISVQLCGYKCVVFHHFFLFFHKNKNRDEDFHSTQCFGEKKAPASMRVLRKCNNAMFVEPGIFPMTVQHSTKQHASWRSSDPGSVLALSCSAELGRSVFSSE